MLNVKNSKGITLIALVITIIVLLILVGISIATLTGENGILIQASKAKEQTEMAQKEEKTTLADYEDYINENTTGVKVEQVTDTNPGVFEGNGTESDPYVINSIEDLVFFAYDVTNGNNYADKYVNLGLSLDFKSAKSYVDPSRTDYGKYGYNGELKTLLTTGEGLKPIGTTSNINSDLYSFAGTFDGNGKLISNLYINVNIENHTNDLRLGFFSNNYGILRNLGLVNCNISGTLDTNGNNTVIVGGFTGYNYGEINSCFVEGNLLCIGKNNAKVRVGGIAGSANTSCIKNCYSLGNINGSGDLLTCVAGIVGVGNNDIIENCFNSSNLTITTTKGMLVSGGISGHTSNVSINNCYNINNLKSSGTCVDIRIGGIVGYSEAISIDNCHNKGNIQQNATFTEQFAVGQIAGTNFLSGSIKNCSYLKQGEYNSIGESSVSIDECTAIEGETNMPSILDIVGSSFKNSLYEYPILYWQ